MNGGNKVPSITQAEHISQAEGENINAKRVGGYVWDRPSGSWERQLQTDPDMAVHIEEAAPITYIGRAAPGSNTSDEVWQIKKIDETSGTTIKWASGNANFINAWDDRASLTYS